MVTSSKAWTTLRTEVGPRTISLEQSTRAIKVEEESSRRESYALELGWG